MLAHLHKNHFYGLIKHTALLQVYKFEDDKVVLHCKETPDQDIVVALDTIPQSCIAGEIEIIPYHSLHLPEDMWHQEPRHSTAVAGKRQQPQCKKVNPNSEDIHFSDSENEDCHI